LELFLADDSLFPHKGRMVFVGRAFDAKTGTINVQAEFPNPERVIRPGQFARVRGTVEQKPNAVLVPALAGQGRQGQKAGLGVEAGEPGRACGGRLQRGEGTQAGRAGDRRGDAEGPAGDAGEARGPGAHRLRAHPASGREAGYGAGRKDEGWRRIAVAQFFIRRPIVAIVISILMVIMGTFTLMRLSFEQYPFLAPPTIRVTATYPGASAVAVEPAVATPIQQEVNGVERMIYMQSSNTSDGRMLLDVNFEVGVNQDTANVLTQNRVASAQARLPQEVNAQGVTVKKQSPSILMLVSVYSPHGSYDANYLINYCGINLRDQL